MSEWRTEEAIRVSVSVNADDEAAPREPSRRINTTLAGAGQHQGRGTKHQAAAPIPPTPNPLAHPQVYFTPRINRLDLQKYAVYISISKIYSVVYICGYIRNPAQAGELNELLMVFLLLILLEVG